ncbi:MAG TPA: phospho-sugar mutase [Clostridiales bacterium]|nr:phospho-sugar mutase [Clostridiales bacterium]
MDSIYKQNKVWLNKTEGYWKEDLIRVQDNPEEIKDRFYKSLDFGTGGLRGIIGSGTNRMNIYTVKKVSYGLGQYVVSKNSSPSIAISYDSRNFSYEFAHAAAEVFASLDIKVHIFSTLNPTPLLSFAVRELKCDAGVMVTASHNPKEYNGYKVYGSDGCQLTLEASEEVLKKINAIDDIFSIQTDTFENYLKSQKIEYISSEVYEKFMDNVIGCSVSDNAPKNIKIVYTPLNGAGYIPVKDILRRRGFENVYIVPEQELPDGNFKTCPYPNPEAQEALSLAIKLADAKKADLILATDPDCDRLGIGVRHKGKIRLITGNEIGILLADYLLSERKRQGTLPNSPIIIKTIVSTDLIYDIAQDYNGEVIDVLTGFKFIGEKLGELEAKNQLERFVFAFEESYGYMAGAYVRDKDGVVASMLVAEMAEHYLNQDKTLIDRLEEIYERYGYNTSLLKSIEFKGMEGTKEMNQKIDAIRNNPPSVLGKYEVKQFKDYLQGIDNLPASNVLSFVLDQAKVLIRPSGTEPKLKIYTLASSSTPSQLRSYSQELLNAITKYFI